MRGMEEQVTTAVQFADDTEVVLDSMDKLWNFLPCMDEAWTSLPGHRVSS